LNEAGVVEADGEGGSYFIRDGIIIVRRMRSLKMELSLVVGLEYENGAWWESKAVADQIEEGTRSLNPLRRFLFHLLSTCARSDSTRCCFRVQIVAAT